MHDYNETTIEDIKKLIMESDNPRDKAELLILLRISQNLAMNTELTEKLAENLDKHVEQFSKHEKDEMALINQGRGFLRAVIVGLALFQGATAWVLSSYLSEFKEFKASVKDLQIYQAEHTAHHKEERETYKAWLNSQK